MNTVITGGTGFVGAELTGTLIHRDERPIVFDVTQSRGSLASLSDRFEYVRGSVANFSELANAFSSRCVFCPGCAHDEPGCRTVSNQDQRRSRASRLGLGSQIWTR